MVSGARRRLASLNGLAWTVAAGLVLGWVGGSLARPAVSPPEGRLASGEDAAALRYVVAAARKDPLAVRDVRPERPIAERAQEYQRAALSAQFDSLGLSWLGSASVGSASVHVYVIEETDPREGTWRGPIVVTVIDGTVIRQRP